MKTWVDTSNLPWTAKGLRFLQELFNKQNEINIFSIILWQFYISFAINMIWSVEDISSSQEHKYGDPRFFWCPKYVLILVNVNQILEEAQLVMKARKVASGQI